MAVATPPAPIRSPAETPVLRRARPALITLAILIVALLFFLEATLSLASGSGQMGLFLALTGGYFLFTVAARLFSSSQLVQQLRANYTLVAGVVGAVVSVLSFTTFLGPVRRAFSGCSLH